MSLDSVVDDRKTRTNLHLSKGLRHAKHGAGVRGLKLTPRLPSSQVPVLEYPFLCIFNSMYL